MATDDALRSPLMVDGAFKISSINQSINQATDDIANFDMHGVFSRVVNQ